MKQSTLWLYANMMCALILLGASILWILILFAKLIFIEEFYGIYLSVGGYPSALKFVFVASSSNFTIWADWASPPQAFFVLPQDENHR